MIVFFIEIDINILLYINLYKKMIIYILLYII